MKSVKKNVHFLFHVTVNNLSIDTCMNMHKADICVDVKWFLIY